MSTPTLKLLLNALRLGQPQDPQAAIFALAEHALAQDELIEDLKKRITVVQSAAQILETKASRLEAELEGWQQVFANMQAGIGNQQLNERDHARFQAEQARAQQQQAQQQQAQQQQAQQQAQQQQARQQTFSSQLVPHGQAAHGPQPAAYQPPRPPSARPPALPENGPKSVPPASMGPSALAIPSQRAPSVAPPPASEPPPPFPSPSSEAPNYNNRSEGTDPVRTRMVRSTPQMTRSQRAAAMRGGRDALVSDDESSGDDFKVETVVVHKKDLERLKAQHAEAPFRLPPPGAGIGPDRGSIPGAPWARGNRIDIKVRPAIADEFTIDAISNEDFGNLRSNVHDEIADEASQDDEGETYRDAGGLPSLAAALGLSPGDPRLEALRRGREPNAGFDADRRSNDDDVPTSSRRKR